MGSFFSDCIRSNFEYTGEKKYEIFGIGIAAFLTKIETDKLLFGQKKRQEGLLLVSGIYAKCSFYEWVYIDIYIRRVNSLSDEFIPFW